MKIRTKISIIAIILSFLGLVTGLVATNFVIKNIFIKVIADYNISLSQSYMDSVDRLIYHRLERWQSYVKNEDTLIEVVEKSNEEFEKMVNLKQYIEEQDRLWQATNKDQVTPFMEQLIESKLANELKERLKFYNDKYSYQIYSEGFVTNKHGVIVASTGKTSDYYQADEDWWQKTYDQGIYVGDINFDESSNINSLDLCIRIDDSEGNFSGVVKIVYNAEDFFAVIDNLKDQEHQSVNAYLLTSDNRLIYSLVEGYGNLIVGPDFFEFFDKDLNHLEYKINDLNGVSKLFAHASSNGFSNFKGLGWELVVSYDSADILAPLDDLSYNNVIAVVFISLFIIIMLFFVFKLIINPLGRLNQDALIIKNGNLNHRSGIKSKDEIGELASSFNLMIDYVNESRAEINKKVKQQTKEIVARAKEINDQKKAILNVLEDIEAEKNKVRKVAADLEKFKQAVDNASDHIVITDPEGVIVYANKAVERITGFKPKEILGKKAGNKDNWGGLMDEKFYQDFWKIIKIDRKDFVGELHNQRKNGEKYDVRASISPVFNAKGEVLFFVGIERDVTKEKQINKAKTEFVSLASHQLRTPLSAINWYTEMLLAGDAGKISREQKQYLKEIYQGNQRMVELVNALLNTSRLELGTFMVEPVATDLKVLVQDVIKEQQPLIKSKKIKFKTDIAEKLPMVKVDLKLLRIVFQNLLSNAIKYTPKAGTVSLSLMIKDKGIQLSIKDSGYGIPKNQQARIFEKLFRADNVKNLDTEGTGLGLYLVKSIITQTGGKLWFKSAEGKGSEFFIWLPLSGMKAKAGTKKLS